MDLLKLIDLIYAAALDLPAWAELLTILADTLHSPVVSLTIADPQGEVAPFLVAPRTDPQWLEAYFSRWASANIVRDHGANLPAGAVYAFETLGITGRSSSALASIMNSGHRSGCTRP